MSVTGSRMATAINLDEFERRLRAAGAQQGNWDDPLSELAKLVETARPPAPAPALAASSPTLAPPAPAFVAQPTLGVQTPRPARPLPAPQPTPAAVLPVTPPQPPAAPAGLAETSLRPAFDEVSETPSVMSAEEAESPAVEAEDISVADPPTPPAAPRGGWGLRVSALALAGVAMIGGVFALKGGVPGLPKTPPFIAAAQGPTKVQPPSEETVASSADSGANVLKDNTQAAHVKVVTSEEQPVDLAAQTATVAAAAKTPPAGAGSPASAEPPIVVATAAPTPPMASQFPDPKPVRTVSLRPDGTLIPASMNPDATEAAPPAVAAQKPVAKPPSKPSAEVAGTAEPSTPKLDLPAKPSKSSARVIVAKTETTAPGANDAAAEPAQKNLPTKLEKAANAKKVAAAEPAAPPAAQPADTAAAAAPGAWAVQLAAPKSEAEAQTTVARLNAKYASALGGSPLGVHKAVVGGETIYRVRVVGMSKADAAALCARLKGDGGECFIAK
jgi:SPOR domain